MNDLFKELEELGYHPDGRKMRSDKGKERIITKTRVDKGQSRTNYNKDTPAYAKRQFLHFLRLHKDPDGEGDTLTRDKNMIFPPRTTNFYKQITVKPTTYLDKRTGTIQQKNGYTYVTSQKRPNHPEELRWRWYHKELEKAKTYEDAKLWTDKICKWYFIDKYDVGMWTYNEWAWAYTTKIAGHFNRHATAIMLDYDSYLKGEYGLPNFDIDGNIIW